ncbi:MAG: hypothetical protein Q9192_007466 [Flavoplaca navasiana]
MSPIRSTISGDSSPIFFTALPSMKTLGETPALWQTLQSLDLPDRFDAEKALVKDYLRDYYTPDQNFSVIDSGPFPAGYFTPGAPLEGVIAADHTAVYKVMNYDTAGTTILHALVIYAHGDAAERLFGPLRKAAGEMIRMMQVTTTLLEFATAQVMLQVGTEVSFFVWRGHSDLDQRQVLVGLSTIKKLRQDFAATEYARRRRLSQLAILGPGKATEEIPRKLDIVEEDHPLVAAWSTINPEIHKILQLHRSLENEWISIDTLRIGYRIPGAPMPVTINVSGNKNLDPRGTGGGRMAVSADVGRSWI